MRIAFGLLMFAAACGSSPDMFPVGGGGNDGGGGNVDSGPMVDARHVDARVADATPLAVDAAMFSGRVCLLTDPRNPVSCASTGAGGLTVRLGTATTTTTADGSFEIAASGATPWTVTGANIVTSVKVQADYLIPVMTKAMYTQLCSDNGVTQPGAQGAPGQGAVMIHVIRNGVGYAGVSAASQQPNPARSFPFYDTTAATTVWTQTAANGHGQIWLVGIDVGTTTTIVTAPNAATLTDANEPILDGAITWNDMIFTN